MFHRFGKQGRKQFVGILALCKGYFDLAWDWESDVGPVTSGLLLGNVQIAISGTSY
jgi:hypothetical protein